jgi:hypothetical protein
VQNHGRRTQILGRIIKKPCETGKGKAKVISIFCGFLDHWSYQWVNYVLILCLETKSVPLNFGQVLGTDFKN